MMIDKAEPFKIDLNAKDNDGKTAYDLAKYPTEESQYFHGQDLKDIVKLFENRMLF